MFTSILPLLNVTLGVAVLMEFAFGLALGYYFHKLIKALIALMILGFIGILINYTQFLALKDALVGQLGISADKFIGLIGLITLVLGLTVVAPITIGLIVGYLVAT